MWMAQQKKTMDLLIHHEKYDVRGHFASAACQQAGQESIA
jgi:hypothetical protein